PMMCALFVKPIEHSRQDKLFRLSERAFEGMLNFYEVGLKWVLRNRLITLIVAIATLLATIYLYLAVPKGLLPNQDTGEIIGVTDAAQNISFKAMLERQRQVSDIVEKDPDVQSVAAFVGAGTVNPRVNTGRLYIILKKHNTTKKKKKKKSRCFCIFFGVWV